MTSSRSKSSWLQSRLTTFRTGSNRSRGTASLITAHPWQSSVLTATAFTHPSSQEESTSGIIIILWGFLKSCCPIGSHFATKKRDKVEKLTQGKLEISKAIAYADEYLYTGEHWVSTPLQVCSGWILFPLAHSRDHSCIL